MSKLNELIGKLCPDGVEYKKLCEITNLRAGDRIIKSMMSDDMKYPVYGGGVNATGKYSEYNFRHSITISRAGSAGYVNWVENEFWATDVCFVASEKEEKYNIKYIYYCVKNKQDELQKNVYGGNLPKLNKDYLWNLHIPVPPLEVQYEIVRILEKFTGLLQELLEELKARQKQYEYYIDKVFQFSDNTQNVKLLDVLISLKTGLNPRKFFKLNTNDADGYYVTVKELGTRMVRYWEANDRVNKQGLERINERSNLEINDVLFSGTGTIGRVSIIEEKPENWNVKEGVYILKPNIQIINPAFLMYLMKSNYMKKLYSNYIVGSPVSSVPMKDLKNVEFKLPTMKEQERIVSILDKFDKLCNDAFEGLPAEIEARKKQYEFYRDKILSFDRRK